jgi:hypothetical protein
VAEGAESAAQRRRRRQGALKKKKRKEKRRTYLPTYLFLRFFEVFRSGFGKYFYGQIRDLKKRRKKVKGF